MYQIPMQLIIKAILCCAFVLINLDAAAQKIGFYFDGEQQKVTIPIEIYNNLIVIPASIDANNQLKFILDTGVRNTILINKDFADSIGVDYKRSVQLVGAGNTRPVNAMVTGPVSLSLPGIKSAGISTLVLEEDLLQLEHALGVKIHGLIGYDLFSRFVVKIDYYHEKMTLFEPGDYKVSKTYFPIDLDVIESKPIANIDLRLNQGKVLESKLLVDTGASHALVLDRKSDDKIVLPEKNIEASLGRGLSGEISGYLGRIDEVKFGKKKLTGVIASFPEERNTDGVESHLRNGSIGGELLKKFTVIFDFVHSKMYVKSNRYFRYPFEYNMSGLEFTAQGKDLNRYVIGKIRKQSAADNIGFQVGDIVTSLNNIPTQKLDLAKIYTKLNLREGKKINLTVIRDGKYISRSFRLKREI